MKNWLEKYKTCLINKEFLFSLGVAFLFFFAGVVASYFAIIYATDSASGPVTDIILSNIPVFDVDGIFVFGPVAFWIIIALFVFNEPRRLPFVLKSIALLLFIRSAFISLTHIGPFPTHLQINGTGILSVFTTGNDLFFSGHTGLPFLMALAFWKNKYIRIFCVFASLFFGAVVLMAHLHYSIDVFAAFFITYTIFHLAERFFKKDRQLFINGFKK